MTGLWQDCLGQLQHELPAQQYNTWIRPLVASTDDNGQLSLSAPNRFVKDWVKDKYLQRIQEILSELNGGRITHAEVVVGEARPVFQRPAVQPTRPTAPPPRPKPAPAPVAAKEEFAFAQPTNNTGFEATDYSQVAQTPSMADNAPQQGDLLAADNSGFNEPPAVVSQAPTFAPFNSGNQSSAPRQPVKPKREVQVEGGLQHQSFLNTNFTFQSFVEGKSNQLAHAAARQVAENAGGSYNPLFIYGGVGLGKTHLMHAVGNYLQSKDPNAKVLYVHSERFVQDMVKALQLNAINEFKRFYRGLDALLIDDIQFFAGKERSQEEFFHTFNALLEGGQQMILTCDRYPKEINGLEERLKSRFGWGLTVAVEPPELETRVAILMKKAEQSNVHLPDDAAFFIAQKIRSNVRELEGALKRVIANSHFTGSDITLPFIKESLKDLLALQDKQVSIDNIQRIVAEYYKLKLSDLLSKRRTRSIARPRQVAMALSKELTNHSLPEIGAAFGGRDHTTVLHACRKIKELQETTADVREDYKNLLRSLTT